MTTLVSYLTPLPLIAVLRGIAPEEADAVGDALADAGLAAAMPMACHGWSCTRSSV